MLKLIDFTLLNPLPLIITNIDKSFYINTKYIEQSKMYNLSK